MPAIETQVNFLITSIITVQRTALYFIWCFDPCADFIQVLTGLCPLILQKVFVLDVPDYAPPDHPVHIVQSAESVAIVRWEGNGEVIYLHRLAHGLEHPSRPQEAKGVIALGKLSDDR